jgi:DNA-binding MarR family transcriptional regulator
VADRQPANLLGALALAVVDRTHDAGTAANGQVDNAAIALSALDQMLTDPSIDTLGRMLGLSSSGTVRLVDRLAAAGLVRRAVGADGRVTTVALTPAGRRASRGVATARLTVLEHALSVLDERERAQFGKLAGRLLAGLIRTKTIGVKWTCRLCDTGACGRPEGRCPVATAARSMLGQPGPGEP